ncbi:hypothetical protein CC85DRAFT_288289, partial [Cutaneotrichosporon oleaginosum]
MVAVAAGQTRQPPISKKQQNMTQKPRTSPHLTSPRQTPPRVTNRQPRVTAEPCLRAIAQPRSPGGLHAGGMHRHSRRQTPHFPAM